MLDYIAFSIPFHQEYIFRSDDENEKGTSLLLNIRKDLGLKTGALTIDYDENDNVIASHLRHPFEELYSSHSSMAIKCYDRSHFGEPCLVIKGSPAKILQGHNVYGDDTCFCIENAWVEMFGLLCLAYPKLIPFLDYKQTEVRRIDSTYSARLNHENLVPKVIDYLCNIGNKQRQPRRGDIKYGTTCYWGGKQSKLLRAKAYGKFEELQAKYLSMKKKADKCPISAKQVETIEQLNLLEYSKGLLRFEATTLHEKLKRINIPTNVFELIKFHKANPLLLPQLWHLTFDPIFDAIKGETMHYATDDELLQKFRTKLVTTTKKGHKRYTKANNAFSFYCQLREFGLEEVRNRFQFNPNSRQVSKTFYRNIAVLVDEMGFSKAHLQTLHKEKKGTIIPMIQLVDVNFENQKPSDYVLAVSQFHIQKVA